MLVTSYYDIYNNLEKLNFEYMPLFNDLAFSDIPITLFTDPNLVKHFSHYPSNVKVIGIPLELFELYNIGMSYSRELPNSRTPQKDTKEFLSLMNTKIEFILRASDICEDDHFIWIDFGILKIIKNKKRFINKLKLINNWKFNKIKIPGCWGFGQGFTVESVNWRFCGGLFIVPRKYISDFYTHSKNVLNDFCKMPIYKLTWETNVWVIIEMFALKNDIDWYFADHNDTILLNLEDPTNQ
jgi:hypothetical protein